MEKIQGIIVKTNNRFFIELEDKRLISVHSFDFDKIEKKVGATCSAIIRYFHPDEIGEKKHVGSAHPGTIEII